MKKWSGILQVSFTYIGTVVGAGFATGQEILQFFTRYGSIAALSILLATALFMWLGVKLMLLAGSVGAKSYEDLNRLLFGDRIGSIISLFTLISLFGVSTVMLAGAGAVFSEQLRLPYQLGLLVTLGLAYLLLMRGLQGIMAVNTVVVPLMICFSCILVWQTWNGPAGDWTAHGSPQSLLRTWFAPFLYASFNLTMAQAVLVPLGAQIRDRSTLIWGGVIGGVSIGLMLLAAHFALLARMPDIIHYQIPTGQLISGLGLPLQLLFVAVIYGEIFTTLLADVYGLSLQLEQRTRLPYKIIIPLILLTCYGISQIGFKTLLSSLYPLFGMLSMAWFVMMIWRREQPTGTG